MGSKLEPAIWSRDTGQRIPFLRQESSDHNMDVLKKIKYRKCTL